MTDQESLDEACERFARSLEPLELTLHARMGRDGRMLEARGTATHGEELEERLMEVFHDLLYFIPLNVTDDLTYRMELEAPPHHYVIQTAVSAIPDTGEVTRGQWEAFAEQLVFTKDGVGQVPVPPDGFIDD